MSITFSNLFIFFEVLLGLGVINKIQINPI